MRLFTHIAVGRRHIATLICGMMFVAQGTSALADTGPEIRFTAEVPAAPQALPLYELHAAEAPRAYVDQLLTVQKIAPLKLETLQAQPNMRIMSAREAQTNNLRAYIDPRTNESVILPNLARTLPVVANIRPIDIATSVLKRTDIIPRDVTTYRIGNGIPVMGAAAAAPAQAGARSAAVGQEAVRFTFVSAMRYASGYPVYGAGSRASVAVGSDGSVQGLLKRWKPAASAGTVATTVKGDAVKTAIREQLAPYVEHNVITVDQIKLAYLDGNAQYLQPVYRFTAILHPLTGRAANSHIAGYIPVGATRENVMSLRSLQNAVEPVTPTQTSDVKVLQTLSERSLQLNTKVDLSPVSRLAPKFIGEPAATNATGGIGAGTISLGEYVNRDKQLTGMAQEFYAGLTMHPIFFPRFGPPIVRTQYYYAYPWEVVGANSKNFLNAVNIAYTQPHGDWYINTTFSNYADIWDVRDIGTKGNPGFGAAAGGKLATWIIDSCEVVPSMYDMSIATGNAYDAFTPWWPVFKGLHNVIGFRTQMWLYDGLNTPFGFAAQLGGDLNAAWFQQIAADPAYNDGYTYYDEHIKKNVHMGRASTFIDARNLGHSIYDVSPQSASSQLWNFWMAD